MLGLGPLLQQAAQRYAVYSGHHHIEQDDIGQFRNGRLVAELSVGLEHDFKPLHAESKRQRPDDILFVVNDEHSCLGFWIGNFRAHDDTACWSPVNLRMSSAIRCAERSA